MNRLKSYIRIAVLTLCVFVAMTVQSLAELQRFALPATEAFIAKWSQSGGSELGSSQNFLLELCDLLEVQRPSSPRADFRGTGVYVPFPSARDNRLSIDDLRRDEVLARLKAIWTDPLSLDPSRENEKVTTDIAQKLAELAKSLEASGHSPEAVNPFLFRCIFTLFAEDAGLLPRDSFLGLLQSLRAHPKDFPAAVSAFWAGVPGPHSSGGLNLCPLQPLSRKLLFKSRICNGTLKPMATCRHLNRLRTISRP